MTILTQKLKLLELSLCMKQPYQSYMKAMARDAAFLSAFDWEYGIAQTEFSVIPI